jgi:hypothetical protein
MPAQAYALFATPIGHGDVAWSGSELTGVQLSELQEAVKDGDVQTMRSSGASATSPPRSPPPAPGHRDD